MAWTGVLRVTVDHWNGASWDGPVDRATYVERNQIAVEEVGNGRWTANISWRKGYSPARGDRVVIYLSDGTTVYFRGIIWTLTLVPLGPSTFRFDTECVDSNVYADQRVVFKSYTSTVSEWQILTDLVANYLVGFGVTLWGSQPNPGTMFDPFTWAGNKKLSACLNDLGVIDGKLWRIDESKVLSRKVPAAASAPFSLSEGGRNWVSLNWLQTYGTQSQGQYANHVIMRFSGQPTSAYAFLAHDPGYNVYSSQTVTVGGQVYTFVAAYADVPGYVPVYGTLGGSLDRLSRAINGTGTPGVDYAASTPPNSMVESWRIGADSLGVRAITPGASGNSIGCAETLTHGAWIWEGGWYGQDPSNPTLLGGSDSALTNMAYADDVGEQAAYGMWDVVIDRSDIFDESVAVGLAAGYLRQLKRSPKVVTFTTRDAGLTVGQKITLSLTTSRVVSGDFLISQISVKPHANRPWEYTVTANEGADYVPSALQLTSRGGGGGTAISGVSGGGSGSGGTIGTPLAGQATLGGNRSGAIVADTYQYVDNFAPFTAPATGVYLVTAFLFALAASVGVTARLYDMTAAAAVSPTSSKITKQAVYDLSDMTTFSVSLIVGHVYALQILSDTTEALVYGQGSLVQAS